MTQEFLKNLGVEDAAIDRIITEHEKAVNSEKQKTAKSKADLTEAQTKLTTAQSDLEALQKSSGDVAAIQQQLKDLQAKYDADIAERDEKIAARDYDDAARASVSSNGIKFSSKAAEGYFYSQLREKKLEMKDGTLTGFDDFLKAQREADPGAFAPDKPIPHFMGPVGAGGAPPAPLPPNVAQAKEMGAARAATTKASNDAMNAFM